MAIIGITTYRSNDHQYYLPERYVQFVRSVGGMPVLLPPGDDPPEQVLALVDGLILAGGGDIDPALYQQEAHTSLDRVDIVRDTFELALARLALRQQTPILGICRGMQVLTVAGGGDLIQHVPDIFGTSVAHQTPQHTPCDHPVTVDPHSRLVDLLGTTSATITSYHHQAARSLPSGWRPVAHAPDGLIEAAESTTHPWMIAIQWHPELTYDQPHHQRLMRAFVSAAARRDPPDGA